MPIAEKSYDQMYPGRFLRAADLDGKMVTVEIADINTEELEGDKDQKSREYILTFVKAKRALVLNKTNCYLIVQMFGKNPNTWPGKRITLYPTTCRFGPKMVDCIRVYGSPDVTEDKTVTERIGRSTLKATIHAVKPGAKAPPPPPAKEAGFEPSPEVLDRWQFLGWTTEEGLKDRAEFSAGPDGDYLAHLSALIDQQNAQEAS
jgi:hypothetical protein